MKIAAQKLNKSGVVLSKEKLHECMSVEVKKYYRICEMLYNLGFSYAMYDFDEKSFLKALKQEFPSDFNKFKDYGTGRMDFSLERVMYVLAISEKGEFKTIVELYKGILESLDAFESIRTLWTKVKFKKSSDTKEIIPRYVITSRVDTAGIIPFYNDYMVNAIMLSPNEKIVSCTITDILYKHLLSKAGVSDADIDSYSKKNKGLVNKRLSFLEECKFVYMILENKIDFDGDFGVQVKNYIESYYIPLFKNNDAKTAIVPFTEYIFTEALPYCVDKIKSYREQNPTHQEVFVSDNSVYFKVECDSQVQKMSDNYVGTCVLDVEMKGELDKLNNLLGYSGEYVSDCDLKCYDWVCDFPPVRLYKKGKLFNYYPSFLVEVGDGITYEPIVGYGTTYSHASSLSVRGSFKFVSAKDDINQLYYLLAKHFELNNLETNMLTALCCIELDTVRDGLEIPNKVGVSCVELDEGYLSSCKKVAEVFSSIKFKA